MSIKKFVGMRECVVACCCLLLVGCSKKKAVEEGADAPAPAISEAVSTPAPAPDAAAVVVEVNGEKLTRGEIDADIERVMAMQRARGIPPQMLAGLRGQVEKQTIERFVGKTVLLSEASKRKVEVSDAEVVAKLDELKTRLPAGLTLEDALSREGMTLDSLKLDIADDFRIRAVIDSCTNGIAPATDAEIAAYYTNSIAEFQTGDSVQARHILLKCDSTNAAERAAKKTEIEGYRKQILEGGDFAALAKEHSDCPSGKKGGDLGSFERGNMVKPFEDAAFSQKINEVGPVVETKFGYHIIETIARSEGATKPLAEVRDGISQQLENKSKQEAVETYVASLKKAADIKYAEGVTPVE